ncbi:hypothetical protein EZ456_15170 [Pedobacter psychrodurus]|uniref:Uncharacterized protein n=1 Tax=Pedobacter psychrodurus TaxID=2530456 RepID=A0A4R0PU80_9SPHI|nr:hypothetical protein [Pedobacter psychrodurus]TCD25597.1 hypothetical protein EZ456_15170 [Pedobacter psychrodurus]
MKKQLLHKPDLLKVNQVQILRYFSAVFFGSPFLVHLKTLTEMFNVVPYPKTMLATLKFDNIKYFPFQNLIPN